jgi:hypothetical protein
MTIRRFRLAGILAALAFVWPHGAPAQEAEPAARPPGAEVPSRPAESAPAPSYFIEFRSRTALSYGHSFVVFGRTGERLGKRNIAGLHPRGNSPVTYVIGHVLPVPSETGASDGDLESQYITARYRVALSPRSYAALLPKIRELQANSPAWNAVAYNCNAFVGDIARLVGLNTPPPWMLPQDFIETLRALNEPAASAMARGATTVR